MITLLLALLMAPQQAVPALGSTGSGGRAPSFGGSGAILLVFSPDAPLILSPFSPRGIAPSPPSSKHPRTPFIFRHNAPFILSPDAPFVLE